MNRHREKDVNLKIAKKTKERLEKKGWKVVMTREKDVMLGDPAAGNKKIHDMKARVERINKTMPQAAVSIHQNSFSDSSVHGAQVFYYANSSDGEQLAKSIQASIHAILDSDNERPVKGNLDYLILKKSPCPAVIVECGFLSNPDECSSLNTPDYQKQVAAAIADGLVNHIQAGTE